jgi:LuxR family maltose regulon positive regulatory protein
MAAPVLHSKLYILPAPREWIPRPRLVERLDAGREKKLTLISAPAGFGKTTLLSSWIAQTEIPIAWLSIDEGDNDPVRFLTYLLAAIQAAARAFGASVGEAPAAMLQSPQPPPIETILTVLINEIAALPQAIVLVLDDYHLVRSASVHKQLAFLLEHLPQPAPGPLAGAHLIITTREDLPLPLARWRARRQVLELRQADLVFTEHETADLMREVMRLDLSSSDIAALQRRTEGWAAGLQLAALSFRR